MKKTKNKLTEIAPEENHSEITELADAVLQLQRSIQKIAKTTKQQERTQYLIDPENLDLNDMVFANLVGMKFQFKSEKRLRAARDNLYQGLKLTIKFEPKNKHDKNACAVYIENKKYGYVDQNSAHRLSSRLQRGEKFCFYLYDHTLWGANSGIIGVKIGQTF